MGISSIPLPVWRLPGVCLVTVLHTHCLIESFLFATLRSSWTKRVGKFFFGFYFFKKNTMRLNCTPCSASCLLKDELPGSEMMTGRTAGTKDIRFPLMFRGLGGTKTGNSQDISKHIFESLVSPSHICCFLQQAVRAPRINYPSCL